MPYRTTGPFDYASEVQHEEGSFCPRCGGHDIEGYAIEVDGPLAIQPMWCRHCESSWEDVYAITCYRNLSTPQE